jgi:hypothetical protein
VARDLDPIELTLTAKQISRTRQGTGLMAAITLACIPLRAWILLPFALAFTLSLALPLVRKPWLRMDSEGLHLHSAFAAHRDIAWTEIVSIEIKARNIVYFLRGRKRPESFRAPWFGIAPTPLLAQLETFRRHYGNAADQN